MKLKCFVAVAVLLTGWLSTQGHSQSPTGCPEGRVNDTCGSACPLTCDNYQDPPVCIQECVEGCFCPEGLVEHNGGCVAPEDCPVQIPECTNGKVSTTCGSACPLTCDNYQDPPACIQECVEGCFCPNGLVEHNGGCVAPEDCGCDVGKTYSTCGTACPITCENRLVPSSCIAVCKPGCFCPEGLVLDSNGSCVDPADCPGADTSPQPPDCPFPFLHASNSVSCHPECLSCGAEQDCEMREGWSYAQCTYVPSVPCGGEVELQCDSEYTYCLQNNLTGASTCVASCLSLNGGCAAEEVCITKVEKSGLPRTQCVDTDDVSRTCPAGQVINPCGAYCQETCEQRLSGEQFVCIEICGPPACVCPDGLLLFRDRCVDPQLCYVLVNYPPAINPLPLVDAHQFLYSIIISAGSNLSDFESAQFLAAIRVVLTENGYPSVEVGLHGTYQDSYLQVVVVLSGEEVTEESSETLRYILDENSATLPLKVNSVTIVDHTLLTMDQFSDVTIWMLVMYSSIPVIFVLAIVALSLACVVNKNFKSRPALVVQVEADKHNDYVKMRNARDSLVRDYKS